MNCAQISFLYDILIIRHVVFIPITSPPLNHHQPHRFTITKKAEIKFRLHSRCSCFEKIGSRLTNGCRRYINKFDCLDDVVSETDRFFLHDESYNENVYVRLTISPAVCDLRWLKFHHASVRYVRMRRTYRFQRWRSTPKRSFWENLRQKFHISRITQSYIIYAIVYNALTHFLRIILCAATRTNWHDRIRTAASEKRQLQTSQVAGLYTHDGIWLGIQCTHVQLATPRFSLYMYTGTREFSV